MSVLQRIDLLCLAVLTLGDCVCANIITSFPSTFTILSVFLTERGCWVVEILLLLCILVPTCVKVQKCYQINLQQVFIVENIYLSVTLLDRRY